MLRLDVFGTSPQRIETLSAAPVLLELALPGWLLGGGCSLKTNQYELRIDTILGNRIVLPNGDIDYATRYHPRRSLSLALAWRKIRMSAVIALGSLVHVIYPNKQTGVMRYETA